MKLEIISLYSFLILLFGGSVDCEETNLRSRKLANPDFDPKSVIVKEVTAKGYVCQIGGHHWTKDDLLKHIDSFLDAWKERQHAMADLELSVSNSGGNGLFHAFILWAAIKNLKPNLIVESGVHMGATSWLIAKASREYDATLVFVDPLSHGWDPSSDPGRTVYDFRGEGKFKDFKDLPWDFVEKDRSNALVFFDDHMDQLRRLKEAYLLGFGHAIFDDNYIAGTGDIFSIKNACDSNGHVRSIFNDAPKRCDMFHRECGELTEEDGRQAFAELKSLADIVWEGPPLTKLVTPYLDVQVYARSGQYEGPHPWIPQIHSELVRESSKAPLIDNAEDFAEKIGLGMPYLKTEMGRYINVVYVKIKNGGKGQK